jgi:hypothetical protein
LNKPTRTSTVGATLDTLSRSIARLDLFVCKEPLAFTSLYPGGRSQQTLSRFCGSDRPQGPWHVLLRGTRKIRICRAAQRTGLAVEKKSIAYSPPVIAGAADSGKTRLNFEPQSASGRLAIVDRCESHGIGLTRMIREELSMSQLFVCSTPHPDLPSSACVCEHETQQCVSSAMNAHSFA